MKMMSGSCLPFCLMRLGISSTERMIRQIAGWNEEETWNVPGVLLAEEQALVYDIKAAKKPQSKGGGWAVKRQREAEAVEAAEN